MKEFIENLLGEGEAAEAICAEVDSRMAALRAEFEGRMRSIQADHAISSAIAAAGGRNASAIRALLDESAIASGDMQALAKQAVSDLKRKEPYLFIQPQVTAPGTGTAGHDTGYTVEELGKLSMAEYKRYRKGE